MPNYLVRSAMQSDMSAWSAMRHRLWPDAPEDELRGELEDYFHGNYAESAFVAEKDDILIGFAEVSIRSIATGIGPRNVAYLEGWYVEPEFRSTGVGRALIDAVEQWAKAKGHDRLASDTWLWNEEGQRAHIALGFQETERVVVYEKLL